MANMNPSERYAMGMSYVPTQLSNVTVPVPKRTGGVMIPGAPGQSQGVSPVVLYAPNAEKYNTLKQDSMMSTLGWVALAAGGLALYYIIK